jgi:hypothetical protein
MTNDQASKDRDEIISMFCEDFRTDCEFMLAAFASAMRYAYGRGFEAGRKQALAEAEMARKTEDEGYESHAVGLTDSDDPCALS